MNATEEQVKIIWKKMPETDRKKLENEYGIMAKPLFVYFGTQAPLTEAGKKLLEEHSEKAS